MRSPSGVQVFSARVPTGTLGGDVFVVQAPVVEEEEDTLLSATEGEKSVGKREDSSPPLDWLMFGDLSEECSSWSNIDNWLTPTPEVVGRAVRDLTQTNKKRITKAGWV